MSTFRIHTIPVLGSFAVRPRLAASIVIAGALFFVLPDAWRTITKLLIGWDFGTALYLILTMIMMYGTDDKLIRRHAAAQDEGGLIILVLMVMGAVASVAAIMRELVMAKNLSGPGQEQAIGLAALTVLLSWFFMQTVFALHYAHTYYSPSQKDGAGGLEFPAKFHAPDYWDFIYFSFVIGTAAATADINITSGAIRRLATVQCIIVFFFNTSILALAINVGASLVSG